MALTVTTASSSTTLKEKVRDKVNDGIIAAQVKATKLNDVNKEDELISYGKRLGDKQLASIRNDLTTNHVDLVHKSFNSKSARAELAEIIRREQRYTKDEEGLKKAKAIVDEIVGFGFIENILDDTEVTDIGWNGTFLTVERSSNIQMFKPEQLGLKDPETDVFRIVKKFADNIKKPFSNSNPILDSVAGSLRLNAIHNSVSTDGTTMSLRVIKSKMALTEDNFGDFAPDYVLEFLKMIMTTGSCVLVGGETGSGKTELMKLMLSFVPVYSKIFLIEDVPEMKLKNLLPDHDIYSLVTGNVVSYSDLVGASLRNYPKWVVPSESRGAEAYEMIEAARTGHSLLSSLHVPNCESMPRRLVTMSAKGFAINEDSVEEDILTNFGFGIHIKTAKIELDAEKLLFYKVRYISEIMEFSKEKNVTVFKQTLKYGRFYVTTNELSDSFHEKLGEHFKEFSFPKLKDSPIEKSDKLTSLLEGVVNNEN